MHHRRRATTRPSPRLPRGLWRPPSRQMPRPRRRRRRRTMWRDAALVAGRDLRIEARSRVAISQVGPFALLVLVLFAFALDPERGVLERATAGLFWVAVLLSAMLTLGRSAALDEADGVRDG